MHHSCWAPHISWLSVFFIMSFILCLLLSLLSQKRLDAFVKKKMVSFWRDTHVVVIFLPRKLNQRVTSQLASFIQVCSATTTAVLILGQSSLQICTFHFLLEEQFSWTCLEREGLSDYDGHTVITGLWMLVYTVLDTWCDLACRPS